VFQVLISTIDYNEYVGRIGVGKIETNVNCKLNQILSMLNATILKNVTKSKQSVVSV
jgi:GTP-binding protein